jgi:ribosomal-protein-alanine N-acetyltransferase
MTVTLREWKKSDAEALAKIANNKKIWDNVRDRLPYPYTKADAKEWLALVKSQKIVTTFCIETDGKMVGSIGFTLKEDVYRKNAEIGYFVGEDYWGQGIATEAIRQMVDYIRKKFDVVRIYAEVFEYNKGSMRALEKNGFYLESIRKKGAIKNDIVIDDYVWVKLLE